MCMQAPCTRAAPIPTPGISCCGVGPHQRFNMSQTAGHLLQSSTQAGLSRAPVRNNCNILTVAHHPQLPCMDPLWLLYTGVLPRALHALSSAPYWCVTASRRQVLVGGGQEASQVTTTGARAGNFQTRFFHKVLIVLPLTLHMYC